MGKKVYCSYWIQTGNCNYTQTGCRYKHEIPKDEETRRAIGFRELPNWPREELSVQAKPAPALHKPWRRPDGKPGFPGAPNASNASGTPIILARGNNQASAGASAQGSAANTQYHPNASVFTAPHQHFPTHANPMLHQRTFSQGGQSFLGNGAAENYQQRSAQNNISPPSYNQSASQVVKGGRSGSSSPPKQPPISRPTSLGQSLAGQKHNNTGASSRKVAPDHHIVNRASGLSGSGLFTSGGNQTQLNARQGYSGMPNNWNPETNGPTSMDISFIAPHSESTRSGSQAVYTPTYTPPSASNTPIPNNAIAFGSSNGNAASDSCAGTPAHHNGNAFAANTGNVPVKGRGPIQFGRHSPAPSVGSARNLLQASAIAEESDATSITSPPVQHRVYFRREGEPEFVTNPPEAKSSQNGKAAHGLKKHGKKVHAANGKSAKGKMSGNGYDLLVDMSEQH